MGSWLTFRVNLVIWRNPLNTSLTFHTGVDLYVSVCMYTSTQACARTDVCPSVRINSDACTCVHRRVHHRCVSVSPSLVSFESWEGDDLLTMEAVSVRET